MKNLIRIFILFLFLNVNQFSQNRLDVVILDAGHGGKDPGTKGDKTGILEKNIVLPITLKLGAMISGNYPDIQVVYTRQKDEFIELKDRTALANLSRGKLFISIHANHKKKEESDKKGFEIYVLNRERFPEAVMVTMKENNILSYSVYGKDTTDKYIFSSLVQNGFLRLSSVLSTEIEFNFLSFTELISRGIYQSGFWVITGASMPSVLIEIGYLSDEADELYLSSEKGQNDVANAIFQAFRRYRHFFEIN
ncbi:MAG: N-acetylmuramoyl-L-alanine amidase [Ignavibacteria bacterium]|nr:N-acetylmuramoyl-L-alanine amidase [Ignavibacteria bacterium]